MTTVGITRRGFLDPLAGEGSEPGKSTDGLGANVPCGL